MTNPLPPYEGDQSYIFVCYAHEDAALVQAEIAWLQDQGVRLWYDRGIAAGSRWTDELARHILGAGTVLFFASPRSTKSENCIDEINYALDHSIPVLSVYLSESELPPGIGLRLGSRQALHRYELDSTEYRRRLISALGLHDKSPVEAKKQTSPRNLAAIVGAVLAAVLIAGYWLWWPDLELQKNVETVAITDDRLPNSIAVLPFNNLSPDAEDAYFAAGIHEEILSRLVKIRDLSVIARTSVMGYADGDKPIPTIARELKVSTVMEGSVRYAGDRVRITAQLIDADTGTNLWSDVYDRNLEDIFAIQSDIAMHITQAMQVQFSQREQAAIAAVPTENLDAYAHYIKASSKIPSLNFNPVHADLDEAIRLDPEFALAIATKAYLYGVLIDTIGPNAPKSAAEAGNNAELAATFARRALDLDPNQALAYTALSGVEAYHGRSPLEYATTAYELDPNNANVLFNYARTLFELGQDADAIALFTRAMAVDPDNALIPGFASARALMAGAEDAAIRWAEKLIEMHPELPVGYIIAARNAAVLGELSAAQNHLAALEQNFPRLLEAEETGLALTPIATGYRLVGDMPRIEQLSQRIHRALAEQNVKPDARFFAHMALHETDAAITSLSRIVEDNYPLGVVRDLRYFADAKYFDPLRGHPAFAEIAQQAAEQTQTVVR